MPETNFTLKAKNNFKRNSEVTVEFGEYKVHPGDFVSDAYSYKNLSLKVISGKPNSFPNTMYVKYPTNIYSIEPGENCTLSDPIDAGDPDCTDCVKQTITMTDTSKSYFTMNSTILLSSSSAGDPVEIGPDDL